MLSSPPKVLSVVCTALINGTSGSSFWPLKVGTRESSIQSRKRKESRSKKQQFNLQIACLPFHLLLPLFLSPLLFLPWMPQPCGFCTNSWHLMPRPSIPRSMTRLRAGWSIWSPGSVHSQRSRFVLDLLFPIPGIYSPEAPDSQKKRNNALEACASPMCTVVPHDILLQHRTFARQADSPTSTGSFERLQQQLTSSRSEKGFQQHAAVGIFIVLCSASKHLCDWPRLDSLLHSVYERQDQSSVAIAARMASLE